MNKGLKDIENNIFRFVRVDEQGSSSQMQRALLRSCFLLGLLAAQFYIPYAYMVLLFVLSFMLRDDGFQPGFLFVSLAMSLVYLVADCYHWLPHMHVNQNNPLYFNIMGLFYCGVFGVFFGTASTILVYSFIEPIQRFSLWIRGI